jgi:hypothetical protein
MISRGHCPSPTEALAAEQREGGQQQRADHAGHPRKVSGGNSLSRYFVAGQLKPRPTEVMARNSRPAARSPRDALSSV